MAIDYSAKPTRPIGRIDDSIQFNYPYGMKITRVSPVKKFGKTYLMNWPYVKYHKSFKVIWPWTNEQEG